MKCIYCGEEMEYKRSYGNGYDEPVEEIYECPRCKAEVSQDYCSAYWEEGTIKTTMEERKINKIKRVVNKLNKKYNAGIKLSFQEKKHETYYTIQDDYFSLTEKVMNEDTRTLYSALREDYI